MIFAILHFLGGYCQIVEGAIAAAVVAAGNASMDEVIQVAIASRTTPKF